MTIFNVPIYDNLPLLGLEDDIDADIDFLVFLTKNILHGKTNWSPNLRIKFMRYNTLCVLHNKQHV